MNPKQPTTASSESDQDTAANTPTPMTEAEIRWAKTAASEYAENGMSMGDMADLIHSLVAEVRRLQAPKSPMIDSNDAQSRNDQCLGVNQAIVGCSDTWHTPECWRAFWAANPA